MWTCQLKNNETILWRSLRAAFYLCWFGHRVFWRLQYTHKKFLFWAKIFNSPLWHHIGSKIGMVLFRGDAYFSERCHFAVKTTFRCQKEKASEISEALILLWCRRPDSNRHVFAYGRFWVYVERFFDYVVICRFVVKRSNIKALSAIWYIVSWCLVVF